MKQLKEKTMNYISSKKRIGIVILCALLILSFCVSGCVLASETSTNENPFLLTPFAPFVLSGDRYGINVYVDPVTGINYMLFINPYKGGICPRYNVDGTLFVSEVK